MAFKRFGFTKLWTDPAAFPTVETDEVQVRADMQVLHDESKNGLNGLMAEMEAKTASASLGAKAPDGSTASNVQKELDDLNAAKHTHTNKALLDTYAQTEADLKSAVTNKHTHSNKTILDAVTASFTTALATAYNRLVTLFSGITSVVTTLGADNTSIPTSKAVSDALAASGALPAGGSTNQVLSKTSAGNYATGWKTITPASIGAATATEVAELKTSVSEGKALVAAAVTDMGVATAATASFAAIANSIRSILTSVSGVAAGIYSSSTATYSYDLSDCLGMSRILLFAYPEISSGIYTLYQDHVSSSAWNYSDALICFIDFSAGTCEYQDILTNCTHRDSNANVSVATRWNDAQTMPVLSADGILSNLPKRIAGNRVRYVAW